MVYFVGAGPGAADLITVRGKKYIEEADVVIYAGSLINKELLKYTQKKCDFFDSSKMTLEEVIDVIVRANDDNKTVVRLHSGEPSLYGTIREQMDLLEKMEIPYECCPGVSACFGAAASLNLEFTQPGVSQSLIITRMEGKTDVPENESIQSLATHRASMAVYLSTGMLDSLSEQLISGGYPADTPAAIVYKATWDDEKKHICTVSTLAETASRHGITKTAVVLIGDAVANSKYDRSRLYAPDFETELRKKGYKYSRSRLYAPDFETEFRQKRT